MPAATSSERNWIRDNTGLVAAYVADKTWGLDYGDCVAFGLFARGTLTGGVVLHDCDGRTVFFSIALEDSTPLTRADLDYIQSIVFDEMQLHRLATRTPKSNARALRMAHIFGLKEEGVEREAGPNSDDVVRFALLSHERRTFTHGGQTHGRRRRKDTNG